MKKRLRKKLKIREFTDFGFHISMKFHEKTTDDEFDSWWDDFIEFIEANDLCFGGGGICSGCSGFVASFPTKRTATDEDRNALGNWLQQRNGVDTFVIDELVDSWR